MDVSSLLEDHQTSVDKVVVTEDGLMNCQFDIARSDKTRGDVVWGTNAPSPLSRSDDGDPGWAEPTCCRRNRAGCSTRCSSLASCRRTETTHSLTAHAEACTCRDPTPPRHDQSQAEGGHGGRLFQARVAPFCFV